MGWSERQRAILRELGIDQFWPVAKHADLIPTEAPAPQVAKRGGESPVALSPPAQDAAPVTDTAAAETGRGAASRTSRANRTPAEAAAQASAPPPIERPRPSGVERMDWVDLRHAVASCQACALCEGRTQAVFGAGHEQAHWMIVGEAPDEHEDREGEPFVGRAGPLLDRMLQALQLSRSEGEPGQQVFLTNVLKCRGPDSRNPEPGEVAQCEPYLQRQIELVRPRVILAMGRLAAHALLKTDQAMGRLRGQVHEVQGIPVVVTFHPSYLLRNPADKALAWDDLCRARALVQAASTPRRSGD